MSKSTKRQVALAAIAVALGGCASQGPATAPGAVRTTAEAHPVPDTQEVSAEVDSPRLALEEGRPAAAAVDADSLPPAPWSADPLDADAAPRSLVAAWRGADNRDRCAPLAPRGIQSASGRTSYLDGGWAVEFDRPGAPGMRADGTRCERCGRAAFGLAGTAMSPDELVSDEGVGEPPAAPVPSFRDGSRAEFTPASDDEDAVAATITVSGQDCVYQVWSFLGEAHARELVGQLRFVAVRGLETPGRVADVRFSRD